MGNTLACETLGEEFAVADRNMLTKVDGLGNQTTGAKAVSIITTAEANSISAREKFIIVYNLADDTEFSDKVRHFPDITTKLGRSGVWGQRHTLRQGGLLNYQKVWQSLSAHFRGTLHHSPPARVSRW